MGEISYEPLIRDMNWSYSRIKCFTDCKYRFYLKYIKYPRHDWPEMFFSSYGKFVHELIADFYAGKKTAEECHMEYLTKFQERVKGKPPGDRVLMNYFKTGSDYLKNLTPSENRMVEIEARTQTLVAGVKFLGFIDRLEEKPNSDLVVVDNKSRNLKPRSGKSTPTKTDEELDEYLRQLYIYSAFVKEKYGKFPTELVFNCFREGLYIEEPFRADAYQDAIQWVGDMVDTIAAETEFAPNLDYFKCENLCECKDSCEYYLLNFAKKRGGRRG